MTNLLARDQATISRLQALRFSPLSIVGGIGATLQLEDGRTVIDFSAGWASASLGYAHPSIAKALADVAANTPGTGLISGPHPHATELAEHLLALMPEGPARKVWFGHSASDANEMVVRALRLSGGPRNTFISFRGSWHGGTAGSMAVSGHPALDPTQRDAGLVMIDYPDGYRAGDPAREGTRILDQLETDLARDGLGQRIRAMFVEPIQSDGGLLVPPEGFFKRLTHILRRHGILLVWDDAKAGCGRTGTFFSFSQEGIVPDIVVLGKGLGGGLPIGAVIGPAALMDTATGAILQTLHGNPYVTAAALSVIKTLGTAAIEARVSTAGARLMKGIEQLQQRHGCIGDVRGRGLMAGIEIVADRATQEPAKFTTIKIVLRALELGLVLFYVGARGNVLELTPPLLISDDELDAGLAILNQAIGDVTNGAISDAEAAAYAPW